MPPGIQSFKVIFKVKYLPFSEKNNFVKNVKYYSYHANFLAHKSMPIAVLT